MCHRGAPAAGAQERNRRTGRNLENGFPNLAPALAPAHRTRILKSKKAEITRFFSKKGPPLNYGILFFPERGVFDDFKIEKSARRARDCKSRDVAEDRASTGPAA